MPETQNHNAQFVRLFVEAQPEIYRYILALTPDMHEAQEILQNTAVALWQKFDQYDATQPFVAWACRFAYYQTLKQRQLTRRPVRYLSHDVLAIVAEERLKHGGHLDERRAALADCLAKLPENDRKLLDMRYGERTTIQDLARQSGQSANVLYKALDRIRRTLHDCVDRIRGVEGVA